MSAAARPGPRPRGLRSSTPRNPLEPAEVAWIALLPCALVAAVAIAVLGPPLGHALFDPGRERVWPAGWWNATAKPEPVKQGRYIVAVLAPLLLPAAILLGTRRIRLTAPVARALVVASWGFALAFVAVGLLEQHPLLAPGFPAPPLFGVARVAGATAIALGTALAATLADRRLSMTALRTLVHETRARCWTSLGIAVAFTATWMLKAPTTDALTQGAVGLSGTWTVNDAFAVLDGRTPLVDYHPVYAKLLLYPAALALWAFGTTTLVYTAFMAVLAGLALLAVYATFRRVTTSSLLALALFLPFVAVSDIGAGNDDSPLSTPAMWPMRYGGTYLLGWLVVRHLARRRPRSLWAIFLVAGIVMLNNLEFGLGATVATAAALLCADVPRHARDALRFAGQAAVGLVGAIAAVSLLTLARADSLPHPALLLEWPRIFTTLGWFSMPLRLRDLHLVIYATCVASIAVAGVRLARRDANVVLTGMLMWSGVFGLLASGYYVGRPDVEKLAALLSAWSFALSMLVVATFEGVGSRRWRPTPPRLLVLLGFALSACTLSAFSPPQDQIARLRQPGSPPVYLPQAERFVRAYAGQHETVAILLPMSYRISYDLALRNVSPYGFMNAIVTRRQMQTLLDTLRRERVSAVFTPAPASSREGRLAREGDAATAQLAQLLAAGYQPLASSSGMIAFSRP